MTKTSDPTKMSDDQPTLASRCTERHYSLGHRLNIRCQLAAGHVSNHEAAWGNGNRCEWSLYMELDE